MALKALKQPFGDPSQIQDRASSKTESLNQSSEIEAPTTLNDFEWQRGALASLSDDERMEYEERGAIMEYDGGLPKVEAEKQALEIIWERRRYHEQIDRAV